MRRSTGLAVGMGAVVALAGCAREDAGGPPEIVYGEDMCAECGMIISDERFATATVVEDERARPEAVVFDDFNCWMEHEEAYAGRTVLSRWVHDHADRTWIPAEQAHYVHAPDLRTPMASGIAAFENEADAEAFAAENEGRVLGFDALRAGDSREGGDGAGDEGEQEGGP